MRINIEAPDFAVPLARQFGASLTVLHVAAPYDAAVDGMIPSGDFAPDWESRAMQQLDSPAGQEE